MTRLPVPVAQINRRLPELGRIRTGVKTPKATKAIDTFRFTSSDVTALGQIAATYGGQVKPWSDDKAADGQYEVITDESEIAVALPPDPLGGTPMYELYTGGGRERWCNGQTCETWQSGGPDGPEPVDVPCICLAKEAMECKPTVHLSLLLPDFEGVGVWRLTTHSWNAAQEIPGMVQLIEQAQAEAQRQGVTGTLAKLTLERKRSVRAGQTRKFIVPVLNVKGSMRDLIEGRSNIGSLAPGARSEIEAGSPPPGEPPAALPAAAPPDAAEGEGSRASGSQAPPSGGDNARIRKMHAMCRDAWPDLDHDEREKARKATIAAITGGSDSSKDLDDEGWSTLFDTLDELRPRSGGGGRESAAGATADGAPPAAVGGLAGLRDLLAETPGMAEGRALAKAAKIARESGGTPPSDFDSIPDELADLVAEAIKGAA